MQVENQEMDAVFKKVGGFLHESAQGIATHFVPSGDNFDHSDDAVAAHVPHGNDFLPMAVKSQIRLGGWLQARRCQEHAASASGSARRVIFGCTVVGRSL